MLDWTLQCSLNIAAQQVKAGKGPDAVHSLCASVCAAAAGGFRPTNAWMQQAWQLLAEQLSTPRSTDAASSSKPAAAAPPNKLTAAVIGAAYTSVVSLQYIDKNLIAAFEAIGDLQLPMRSNCAAGAYLAWLKWLAVGSWLGGSTFQKVQEQAAEQLSAAAVYNAGDALSTACVAADMELVSWCVSPVLRTVTAMRLRSTPYTLYSMSYRARDMEYVCERLADAVSGRAAELRHADAQVAWRILLASVAANTKYCKESESRATWESLASQICAWWQDSNSSGGGGSSSSRSSSSSYCGFPTDSLSASQFAQAYAATSATIRGRTRAIWRVLCSGKCSRSSCRMLRCWQRQQLRQTQLTG
jgi:hypothetical protein